MTEPQNKNLIHRYGGTNWRFLAVVVVVLVLLGWGWWWFNGRTGMSPEQAEQWTQLADEANVCLENEIFRKGFEEAENRYVELKKALPNEILPFRNHAILRILRFKSDDDLKNDEAFIEETFKIMEELLEKDPDAYQSYILAVRWRNLVYQQLDETDVELLATAGELADGSPVPFVEFYESTAALNNQDLPGIEEKRAKSLERAYQLQKDNLKLALVYLAQLAGQENLEQFSGVWKEFEENLGGIVVGVDLEEGTQKRQKYLEEIREGIKEGDWGSIQGNVRFLGNLIRPNELYKIDGSRVQPHELEFMVSTLGKEIIGLANQRSKTADAPSPVVFESGAVVFESSSAKPLAVRSVDFDLDGGLEVAVLLEGSFLVFDRPDADSDWVKVCHYKLDHHYDGILVADLDFDYPPPVNPKFSYADPDFVLFGKGGLLVLENKLNQDGQRIVEKASAEDLNQLQDVTAAVLSDVDHDMDLDLVVGAAGEIKLFLSRGNLSFFDFSQFSQFPSDQVATSLEMVDFDRDIDIDLIVGFKDRKPGYLENLGHAKLRFREFDSSFSDLAPCKAIKANEMDGQMSWDLTALQGSELINRTTLTNQGSVRQKSVGNVTVSAGQRFCQADFNNDGFLDTLIYRPPNRDDDFSGRSLALGNRSTRPVVSKGPEMVIDDCDFDDLDADGKIDLVVISGEQVRWLRNVSVTDHNWVAVNVCGISSNFDKGRINNFAVGSFVELKVGDRYFATVSEKPRLHFGLGKAEEVDLIRFLWPSGMPQSLFKIQTGQLIYEEMFEKGSCPYIYTWNGQQYTFFSDCLWAAPLGLQSAPGKFIPCREWEYLKIPSDFMKPIDGEYRIQLTEELREAAYFDLIELYAIDHPAGVEIFTNEKVGPPFIAEPGIHTVGNPQLPVSATDMYGKDVLPEIARDDKKYFRGFQNRIAKGLAPLHYLELDLGDLESADELTLFLKGWIRPTDCSLNISFAQRDDMNSPQTPVILVPNEKGEWVKTVDPMGFPGGKPKTIAVDLSKAFLTDDYRLRIQTSHEIYWDQVFFTQAEERVEWKQIPLPMVGADLHYRGFSKRFVTDEMSPEWYDYQQVTTTARWPAMSGRFTRYGEVESLLGEQDDCHVVMGSGDEMTVRFSAIDEPPPGWRRDFVIHLVGYDKDADLNTVTGQTVGPLPFKNMSRYPYGGSEHFPDSEKHREYLRKFQTRQQRWSQFWKNVEATD